MRLIPDWRSAWRYISTRAMALSLAVTGSWLALPEDWRARLPDDLISWITIPTLIVGVVGRFVIAGGRDDLR